MNVPEDFQAYKGLEVPDDFKQNPQPEPGDGDAQVADAAAALKETLAADLPPDPGTVAAEVEARRRQLETETQPEPQPQPEPEPQAQPQLTQQPTPDLERMKNLYQAFQIDPRGAAQRVLEATGGTQPDPGPDPFEGIDPDILDDHPETRPILAALDKVNQRIDQLAQSQAQAEQRRQALTQAERAWHAGVQQLQATTNSTVNEAELRAVAQRYGLANPEVALKVLAGEQALAQPTPDQLDAARTASTVVHGQGQATEPAPTRQFSEMSLEEIARATLHENIDRAARGNL